MITDILAEVCSFALSKTWIMSSLLSLSLIVKASTPVFASGKSLHTGKSPPVLLSQTAKPWNKVTFPYPSNTCHSSRAGDEAMAYPPQGGSAVSVKVLGYGTSCPITDVCVGAWFDICLLLGTCCPPDILSLLLNQWGQVLLMVRVFPWIFSSLTKKPHTQ